jgi:hypothetical protein
MADEDGTVEEGLVRHFQGSFAPGWLFQLVDDGTLDVQEAWLWLNINSFQEHGRYCYACNATLGRYVGVKIRKVQYIVTKLEGLGLLLRGLDGERRVLTTIGPIPPAPPMHGGA